MEYPFCSCGSYALIWDPEGGMEKNAPFPEKFESLRGLTLMACIRPFAVEKRECAFCVEFKKRCVEFKKKLDEEEDAASDLKSFTTDLGVKQAKLRADEVMVKRYEEKTIPQRLEAYEKKFERDPTLPLPEECSGHYKTTENTGCSGCWHSGYGIDGCNHPKGCQDRTYQQDHNDKCPKCMHREMVTVPQEYLISMRTKYMSDAKCIQEMVESGKKEELKEAAEMRMTELKELWEDCYKWLEARLEPFEMRPRKKARTEKKLKE